MKAMFKHLSKLIGSFLISAVACSIVLLVFIKLGYLQTERNEPALDQPKFDQLVTRQWLFQRLAEQENEIALLKRQVSILQGPKPRVDRSGAWIGVNIHEKNEGDSDSPSDYGVVVAGIFPGGPASRSGIAMGDILTAVEGEPVEGVEAFQNAMASQQIGQVLRLSAIRDERTLEIDLTPEAWPK